MGMYPRVVVRLDHLRENVKVVRELCEKNHISITGVTKVFRGDPKIDRKSTRLNPVTY